MTSLGGVSMLKHAVVLAVAVAVALSAARELASYSGSHAAATARAQVATVAQAQGAAGMPRPGAPAEVVKASDGHYWAEAEVNGRWIHCLVDTGATAVALTPQDAARLGLDVSALSFDTPVSTAHGQTRAARVELDHVAVAGARVDNVPAMVVQDGLAASLLGMSYLGRLSRIEATPTTLILRP